MIIPAVLTCDFGEKLQCVGQVSKEVRHCPVDAAVPGPDTEAVPLWLSTNFLENTTVIMVLTKLIIWFCCLIFAVINWL